MAAHPKYSGFSSVSNHIGGIAFIYSRIGIYIQVYYVELCVVVSISDEKASSRVVNILEQDIFMLVTWKTVDAF